MTGLSPHVIRIWERRYGAVVPVRTATRRRRYTTTEVNRLNLLRQATNLGHTIGAIAKLTDQELTSLVATTKAGTIEQQRRQLEGPLSMPLAELPATTPETLAPFLSAIKNLDSALLEVLLNKAAVDFGTQGLLVRILAPLVDSLGKLWSEGTLTAAHEHFATTSIRDYLKQCARPFLIPEDSPAMVVATPAGQAHETGAAILAAAAASQGWRIIYLGANLPAADLAGAVTQTHAGALALSIVFPTDDAKLAPELAKLRRLLPPNTKIIAAGAAVSGYESALKKAGATVAKDLEGLFAILAEMRGTPQH